MTEQPANARRRVVVLGAGYAGLTCFLELQDRLPRSHDLVLVSRDRYHWFTTELHTYAAGHDPDTVRIPLRRLVAPPGRLVIDHVAGLRPAERRVELKISGPQVYDLLVFALGSEPEYSGLPGIPQHALTIGSPHAARQVRERVRALVETGAGDQRANTRDDGGGDSARVLVVGGGLTGVELAAELADEHPGRLWVTILEAAPDIMAGFPPDLVRVARRILEEKGIRLVTGSPIVTADATHVYLQDGREIGYDLLVWAGGVRGHSLLAEAGLELGGRGRARVDAFLRSVSDDRIYVIGDAASFTDPVSGREVPPTGQAAVQMGKAAAENILRRLSGQPEQPFAFRLRGQFASLGHHEGVGTLGQENLVGLPAVAVKHFVEGLHAWEMGGGVMPLVRKLVAAPLNYLRGRRLRQRLRPRRALREQPP